MALGKSRKSPGREKGILVKRILHMELVNLITSKGVIERFANFSANFFLLYLIEIG